MWDRRRPSTACMGACCDRREGGGGAMRTLACLAPSPGKMKASPISSRSCTATHRPTSLRTWKRKAGGEVDYRCQLQDSAAGGRRWVGVGGGRGGGGLAERRASAVQGRAVLAALLKWVRCGCRGAGGGRLVACACVFTAVPCSPAPGARRPGPAARGMRNTAQVRHRSHHWSSCALHAGGSLHLVGVFDVDLVPQHALVCLVKVVRGHSDRVREHRQHKHDS